MDWLAKTRLGLSDEEYSHVVAMNSKIGVLKQSKLTILIVLLSFDECAAWRNIILFLSPPPFSHPT